MAKETQKKKAAPKKAAPKAKAAIKKAPAVKAEKVMKAPKGKEQKSGGMGGFIKAVEKLGHKLPHPVFLFVYLGLFFMIMSVVGSSLNWGNPLNAAQKVKSLLDPEGVYWMFSEFVNNFAKYGTNSIFGTIILLTMAVGVGTSTGYWNALIKKMTLRIPKGAVAYFVVGIGAFTSLASDAGYVVFVPLAAIIFVGYGRHPIAGIAAAFSGVSAGFSATLLPGASDAIFAEVWSSFAGDHGYHGVFNATTMWFFQVASLIMLTFVGGWVTDKFVEPALSDVAYKTSSTIKTGKKEEELKSMTKDELRGLKFANWALLITIIIFVIGAWPGFGPLAVGKYTVPTGVNGISTGGGLTFSTTSEYRMITDMQLWTKDSLFMKAISLNLGIIFFIAAIAYGKGSKSIIKKEDVIDHQKTALKGIGGYIVISIIALNVIKWFNYTNLGATMTGHIAEFLQTSGMADAGMLVMIPAVLIITMLMNLVISGMSSKGYILGPIFLALASSLQIEGRDVVAIGVIYRIADSVTNIITPIMSYFIIILAVAQGYCKNEEDFGAGNLIAIMMPYSIFYLLFWSGLFIVWYLFQLPFGL